MNKPEKTLILFPEDPTTSFLEEIFKFLIDEVPQSKFDLIRIAPLSEAHNQALKETLKPTYKTVAFIGHGTNNMLFGARSKGYENKAFITAKEFSVFKGKKLVLISCDSGSLLKKNRQSGFLDCIGFGDLPTDWSDIQSAREVEANSYKGFTQENMELFKGNLVEVFKYSFADFLKNDLSIKELYTLIELRINKRLAKYYLENRGAMPLTPLNDCLLRMKSETIYLNSSSI